MPETDDISMQEAINKAILCVVEENKNTIVIATNDSQFNILNSIKEELSEVVINIGITDRNMFAAAAGAASIGNLVFAEANSFVISLRSCEQIRTLIAFPKLNVKIISKSSGVSFSHEGVPYHAIEDIGIMRSIPGMTIVVPADNNSAEVIIKKTSHYQGPVYIRLGMDKMPRVFDKSYEFEIGKANYIKKAGGDAAIICNGAMVIRAIAAEKILSSKGYNVQIIEMPCVKPIDRDIIIKAASETEAIVTIEEHNIIGGLGSAVAEVVADELPVLVKRIGIKDTFTESGSYEKLLDKYGLSVDCIVNTVTELINSKYTKSLST